VPQSSDFADIVGSAPMDFESVPQVLVSFYWFATQFSWSEEFQMASLAGGEKGCLAHVFKNQESPLNHRFQSFTYFSDLLIEQQVGAIWRTANALAG
jgi:hypothetical protein